MTETRYRNRRAFEIENNDLRVTVLVEGGHIAAITHKATGVNPLWTPPWPSIEPSTYDRAKHPEYGIDAESKLLSGIMGHNLCLDLFGPVTPEEAQAGMTVHGEGSVVPYHFREEGGELISTAILPSSQLRLERRIRLGNVVAISETVENLSAWDRPIAWTQHATLGPPFLERGLTQFRAPGTRSRAFGTGEDFDWPRFGTRDLQLYTSAAESGGFTTHLMDPHREQAYFIAYSPKSRLEFGYVWKRSDFPWLGIWEENHSRKQPPWNGNTMTRGMEFGASPMPETRRQMIERGSLFGVPAYRWLPAKGRAEARYCAFARNADRIANAVEWDGADGLKFSE
jgi:hypothetical protein